MTDEECKKYDDDCDVEENFSVTRPPDSPGTGGSPGSATVTVPMPTMTKGTLCRASGITSPPPNLEAFVGLYVKVLQGSATPTGPFIYANPDCPPVTTVGPWNLGMQLPAWVGAGTTPQLNTFCAITVTRKWNGALFKYDTFFRDPTYVGFNGIRGDCTVFHTTPAPIPKLAASTAPAFTSVDPVDLVNGWLLYRNVSVSIDSPGIVLRQNGQPLRARFAAFAVRNPFWQYRIEDPFGTVYRHGVIHRAAGECITADSNFVFPGAPRNAIVVSQSNHLPPGDPFVHVLSSESRRRPDYIELEPADDIRLLVNYEWWATRSGQFDLWVKVIDT